MKELLIIGLVLLVSCKEKEQCYECQTKLTITSNYTDPVVSTTTNKYCGTEISDYERSGTFDITSSSSGVTVFQKTVTTCR